MINIMSVREKQHGRFFFTASLPALCYNVKGLKKQCKF